MSDAIATITGTALKPGVSKNKRWYKPEHVQGAHAKAAERIAAGDRPMVMLTYHDAQDNSREIAAALTRVSLGENGALDFAADILGTDAGWDIAKLADTTNGRPALRNVSIRGAWTGKVRRERHPDGQMVETADGLVLDGVDFTKSPGVEGAEIKTFDWASDGQNETDERVLITESVQEARVTISEETAPADQQETGDSTPAAAQPPEGVREALALFLGTPVPDDEGVEEAAGTPPMSKRGSGTSGGGRQWADPGYQADKRQRYDVTTKGKALTAWRYIHQKAKAAKYTPAQLKRIKGRIKSALAKFGVKVSNEHAPGWGFTEAVQISGDVLEWFGGDPKRSGSWCVSASNGPVNLTLSSYSMDPADLDVILRAAADAACKALQALDPDMDGDIDVDGAGDGSDTDGDSGKGESAEPGETTEETDPAPAGEKEGDPAMGDTTTQSGGATLTLPEVQEAAAKAAAQAVQEALAAERKERKARKKAARKAAEAAAAAATSTTETGDTGEADSTAAAEAEQARIAAAVEEALKARGIEPEPELTEDEKIEAKVTERLQALVADGSVAIQRAGLVEHAAPTVDNAADAATLAAMSEDDFRAYGGGALDKHLGMASKRIDSVHT